MSRVALLVAISFMVHFGAAESAPLIDGLGGPLDLGEPAFGIPDTAFDLTTLPGGGLRFYDRPIHRELFVNRPGSLSFDAPICCFNITWELPAPPFGQDLLMAPRIVPYQAAGGQFYVGPAGPETFMYAATRPGADGEPDQLIATWHQVPDRPPELPDVDFNSWQAIITPVGDAGDFDVEFRFAECEWTQEGGDPRRLPYPVSGFDAGRGEDGPGWMWPGSLTPDTALVCELSNVREPGVFRYAFREGWPSGCGYDVEPPPGPDRCADGNHLPGDGCSPACYVEPDVDGDARFEAPHPDSVDPQGVYDDCTDLENPDCDDDLDDDGVPDIHDNCPEASNADQRDLDDDTRGDACDVDADGDGLQFPVNPDDPNSFLDLCPNIYSRGGRAIDPDFFAFAQPSDIDGDGLGDQCDPDDDGDGIDDCGADGICAEIDNGYDDDRDIKIDEEGECAPDDERFERCNAGDLDLQDNDLDGFIDERSESALPRVFWPGPDEPPAMAEDNCRVIANPDQRDTDADGVGDACDPDMDGDGVFNCVDGVICGPARDARDNDADGRIDEAGECAAGCDPLADRVDQDRDGFVDEYLEMDGAQPLPAPVDNCPTRANFDQLDSNGDGIGDACADDDGDGVPGGDDNCIGFANPDQADLDADGEGDACDPDDDGDGVDDIVDVCPRLSDDQADLDGDGIGDACDPDDDEDGVNDPFDLCPMAFDPDQADLDGDGEGDACDADDDGDQTPDEDDTCPRLADDQRDTDGDGMGDACDDDDDGDGVADVDDGCPRVADADQPDLDGDGIGDACDPMDDRIFDERTPAEQCAILIADESSTARRLAICPAPVVHDTCAAAPGPTRPGALLLVIPLLVLARRRR